MRDEPNLELDAFLLRCHAPRSRVRSHAPPSHRELMLALLPPCILAISQMILPPSEPPSWPCGHGRHLPQLLQFNGRRSIAVQPSRHRRRDSPTGPKTGCRLHGPPRSPDAESRPRGAVFGGAAPLAAHVKKGYSRNSLFPLVFPLASPCYFECAYSAASCLIPQLACSKSDQLLVV